MVMFNILALMLGNHNIQCNIVTFYASDKQDGHYYSFDIFIVYDLTLG